MRFEKLFAGVVIDGLSLLQDGERFFLPVQAAQCDPEAVENEPFGGAIDQLARQAECDLVLSQCVRVLAALPLEDAERVAQRELTRLFTERRRQGERSLELRYGLLGRPR